MKHLSSFSYFGNYVYTVQIQIFTQIYRSTFGARPLFTGMASNSVRMHKNSAHIHVIIADAEFNNHQNRVGKDPLYHIQATKCMMCIVQAKSKHNRYRSTIRQMNVALSKNIF